jgi:3-oxoacyl-[acyl-carrier-protein] synthase II
MASFAPTIVITGMGAASAVGTGCATLWRAVEEGRDGLRNVTRFDTRSFPSNLAGLWPTWDERIEAEMKPGNTLRSMAKNFPLLELARAAAAEAWAEARVAERGFEPRRVALVLGTCFGQGFLEFHEITEALGDALGIAGPRLTVSTACSSSTNAVGLGRDLLVAGHADIVVAGGADTVLREVFAGFCALGVVSAAKCAPFSEPPGINLGEGAGFVVLERAPAGAPPPSSGLAEILGYGLSSDAFHETTPDPTGAGIARAIRGALADAHLEPGAIDYINAHATGTESHDRAEWSAIGQAFGERRPATSATKSFLGHAQGAAGVLELIVTVLCMRRGVVPPTLRFTGPRPGCPEDPVAGTRPRAMSVRHALDVSAAFGGANAVLAIGRASESGERHLTPAPPSRDRVIVVRGLAAVGPHGTDVEALVAAATRRERLSGDAAAFDLSRIANTADPRRLDRSGRLLTASAALALRDAGIRITGPLRDRVGLFLGATRMPAESSLRCVESIEQHGVMGCSAASFARMSVNAPAGACAKLLGLRGPSTTVSAGQSSGLLAVLLAAEWLSNRDDADFLVTSALDERPPAAARARLETNAAETDGAITAVLAHEPASAHGGRLVVAGWGLAGPGDAASATRDALAGGARPECVWGDGEEARGNDPHAEFFDVGQVWTGSEACGSAVAFLLAAHALRTGRARTALAVAARGRSATCAVLLQREERS